MRQIKKISVLLAAVLLLITCFSASAFAATSTQDGIKVDITTDKDSYLAEEKVQVNLVIENTNSYKLEDLNIETLIPTGLKELADSKLNELKSLAAGEKVEYSFELILEEQPDPVEPEPVKPDPVDSDPDRSNPVELDPSDTDSKKDDPDSYLDSSSGKKTGETFNLALLISFIFVAVSGSLFLYTKRKYRKIGRKVLSLLLPITLLAGGLGQAKTHSLAADEMKSFQVSHEFKIADEEYSIKVDISYLHKTNEEQETPDSDFLNPEDEGPGQVNRLSWISDLVDAANLSADIIDSDPVFLDVDMNNPFFEAQYPDYSGEVEIALQNNVISIEESKDNRFYPERAATEEFAVVSAVRALGFTYESLGDIYQIANDIGIFVGTPSTDNLTINLADNILALVSEISKPVSIDPEAEQIVDINEDVIILSETDLDINYSFDYDNDEGEIQLDSEAKSMFEVGDTIILPPNENYSGGLAQKIVSIRQESDDSIILETEMPDLEDILGEEGIQVQGYFEADVDNFKINPNLQSELGPEWKVIDNTGDAMGFSSFSTFSSNPLELSISTGKDGGRGYLDVGISITDEKEKNSASISSKVYVPELEAYVDLEYAGLFGYDMIPYKVNYLYMAVDNQAEFSMGAETEFIDKKVKIGEFPIPLGQPALTANIVMYIDFAASGSVSINYSVESLVGIEYVNKHMRIINDTESDNTVQLEANVEAGIRGATELNLFGLGLADMNARIGVGANGSLTSRESKPEICIDVTSYVYMKLAALQEGVISDLLDLSLERDIWNKDHSPFKKSWHYEGPPFASVPDCTAGTHDVELPYFKNLSFEDGISGWTTKGDVRIISSLGILSPTEGQRMVIAGTGFGAVKDSDSSLSRSFTVPSSAKYLTLDYNFVSEEPMTFVGTQFDDTLIFNLIKDGSTEEMKRETINTSQWICIGCGSEMPKNSNAECCTGPEFDYFPGGKKSTYHTGWKPLSIEVSELTDFTLEIRIFDKGDSAFDSAVLLDNLRFTDSPAMDTFKVQAQPFTSLAVEEANEMADDKTALEDLISSAKDIDRSLYSLESLDILDSALVRAEHILMDSQAEQKDVDVITNSLQSTIHNLD